MLRKRVITALWLVPLLVLAVWFDWPLPWFTVFVAVWALLALSEFYRLVSVSSIVPLRVFGIIWTLLFILAPQVDHVSALPLLLTSAIVVSLIMLIFVRTEGAFSRWAWALTGTLYAGWLLSYLVVLRLEAGPEWVYLAIFITVGTDTAAYFVGKAIGRHKLAPHISPAKTWEGAIAGVFGAVIFSLVLVGLFAMPLTLIQAILLGILVSIFGQLGGLAISLLKRNAGVKDSGTMLPGHGGVLDRTDSIVFAAIVVYYFSIVITVW